MSVINLPMSPALVGMIFAKLKLTYGRRFTGNYEDPPEVVRAHWARELAGLSEQSVVYALERLPSDYVPNVLQFRMLASNRPQYDDMQPRLPPPRANPEIKRKALEALAQLRAQLTDGPQPGRDPLAWAQRIRANPQGKSLYARKLAEQALKEHGR